MKSSKRRSAASCRLVSGSSDVAAPALLLCQGQRQTTPPVPPRLHAFTANADPAIHRRSRRLTPRPRPSSLSRFQQTATAAIRVTPPLRHSARLVVVAEWSACPLRGWGVRELGECQPPGVLVLFAEGGVGL